LEFDPLETDLFAIWCILALDSYMRPDSILTGHSTLLTT
jgi:hypothetical protein